MKKISLLSLLTFLFCSAFSQGICPKTYTAEIKTTFETLNFSDGEIEILNVSGGTSPYSYNWSTGVSGISDKISNLSAGQYNLTISDANGCPYKLCVLLDKDSVPCSSALRSNICNQTIPVNQQFWFFKKPFQTGVQIELYDLAGQLLSTTTATTFNAGGFYQTLTNNLYYSTSYKMVSKGIYGNTIADFCDDTCTFTVEDFPCYYNWNANSCQDTVPINKQFWIQKYPHMTAALIEIYDDNGNLINTQITNNSNGGGFYRTFTFDLYYEKDYSFVVKGIYNSGDTSTSCGDTCGFTVATFTDGHLWPNNSCRDTIPRIHQLWVQNQAHLIGVKYNLFDPSYNLINTWTSNSRNNGGVWTFLNNQVTEGNDYCIVTQLIYEDPNTSAFTPDTSIFTDTCCFHVEISSMITNSSNQTNFNQFNSSLISNGENIGDDIVIYPNPIREKLNISSKTSLNRSDLIMYSIDGKKVEFNLEKETDSKASIDVSSLKNGSYFIMQIKGDESQRIPFIISR